NNETSASQAQNSYSDSSPKSHYESRVKQISESQSIPNTPNLPEESSEQNTDLQKTKIPEIDVQPLIEELRIEPLVEDTVKVVNVDKNSTDKQSLAIELNNETSASQAQNSYSDSSPKSHDELHVKQISESQSIPNTPNLPEESSEQNTDLQKTKIPEIDVQPLIEELRIEPLVEDTVKVVNVDKNSTDKQSLAIELVHLFEKISLAENNTK
ncbi:18452_t:CDS:2, partial [Entrophospora sp. SA101]